MTDEFVLQPLYLKRTTFAPSGAEDESWIGSPTVIPRGEPHPACRLCEARLAQFFTFAFPDEHPYAGDRLTLYSCVCCATEDGIPDMPPQLPGARVSSDFLRDYQKDFRLIVAARTAWQRVDAEPGVRGCRLEPVRRKRRRAGDFAQLLGPPRWLLEDESPATVAERTPAFLAQVFRGHRFDREDGAPRQPDPFGFPPADDYLLMNANELYLFGPESARGPVYLFTQVD